MEVSVVLCTYDPDLFEVFRDAANSVLSQTYEPVELVIVVDGSDELAERARTEYGARENVIIHCNETNEGLTTSRNTGASLATGEIVAFIDDDAIAEPEWIANLVSAYNRENALAVGGKMTPNWVAGKPEFLPPEFYWLIGVTHRGFAEGPGEVRNTFGSNISFNREVFLELGGFEESIGMVEGGRQNQAGETELCERLRREYRTGVFYTPEARVAHCVFDYRTRPGWLFKRAFWQGHSKRLMDDLTDDETEPADVETEFLGYLIGESIPMRLKRLCTSRNRTAAIQLSMLIALTAIVGMGYLFATVEQLVNTHRRSRSGL